MAFKIQNISEKREEGRDGGVKEYVSNSIQDTFRIAGEIATSLSVPSIIHLEGDLGAGKTHFVKGFAKALGVDEMVTSPTFTIMNEYVGENCSIYHFDMYRLSSAEEALALGFEEYFDLKTLNGFSLVEWAENVEGIFPDNVVKIEILKTTNENQRRIIVR